MSKLVAGPWVGELGWELMSFQAFIRKAARDYTDVIVCARAGHEPLYADFATGYVPHEIKGVKDCWSTTGIDLGELRTIKQYLRGLGGDQIEPAGLIAPTAQRFVRYGSRDRGRKLGYNFDIVCHARKPIGKRPAHSWPQANWDMLVRQLDKDGIRVAAIGTEAYLPDGAVDMRTAGLQDVMDALAAATLAMGPSSGPMHLASLCNTPHIIWTDTQVYSAIGGTNKQRYEQIWNPLKTPCKVIDQHGWNPPPYVVYATVQERLKAWSNRRLSRSS